MEQPLTSPSSRTSVPFFLLLLAAVFVLNVEMIAPYGLSLLIGSILAVLTYPAYARVTAGRIGPLWGAGIITAGLALLVIGPLVLFGTMAVKQAVNVGRELAQNESLSFTAISNTIRHWRPVEAVIGDPAAFDAAVRSQLQSLVQSASGLLLSLAQNLPAVVIQSAIALMTCFFMLADGRALVRWTLEKLPLDHKVQDALISTFHATSVSVVLATIAAAAVQAAVLFVGFLVLGVPGAFLAGGATFIGAWIPVVGPMPVWVAGCAYLYAQDHPGRMVGMLGVGLFSGVIDNFIRPLVLKGRSEMHPLVSLVAILGGIEWFGLTGVLVGPVLISMLISLMELWPTVSERAAAQAEEEAG